MTRERPILFNGEMVRAILAGRKTVTRRVARFNAAGRVQYKGREWHRDDPDAVAACPFGAPGDTLWVKEAWGMTASIPLSAHEQACRDRFAPREWLGYRADTAKGYCWKSPRYMPRWASRITLEVTGRRLERVQDISEADAEAEGVERGGGRYWLGSRPPGEPEGVLKIHGSAVAAFADLWDSINGSREGCSWESNLWVWAVSFRRVTL